MAHADPLMSTSRLGHMRGPDRRAIDVLNTRTELRTDAFKTAASTRTPGR